MDADAIDDIKTSPALPAIGSILEPSRDILPVSQRQSRTTMPDSRSGYVMVIDSDGYSECQSFGLGSTTHGSPGAPTIGRASTAGVPKENLRPNSCPEGNPECHSLID